MIDYENFRRSLKNLELQHDNHQTLDMTCPQLTQLIREGIAESVIQRFETCYDTMWQVTKRYLTEELGIPEVPNSPRPIFRLACENNLLPSPIERWMEYSQRALILPSTTVARRRNAHSNKSETSLKTPFSFTRP